MDPISPCVCSTNSGIMGVFSGMHTITGYPVVTTEIGQNVPVLFDQQSPTQGNFSFEPGSIELDPYRITPGTLTVYEAGYYEVYYDFSGASASVAGQYDTAVTVNGTPILNSIAHITMAPDNLYEISRRAVVLLNVGDNLQVTVQAFTPGQFIIGGNTSQLIVHRIGTASTVKLI